MRIALDCRLVTRMIDASVIISSSAETPRAWTVIALPPRTIDETGQAYGALKVVDYAGNDGHALWLCECGCGQLSARAVSWCAEASCAAGERCPAVRCAPVHWCGERRA